jgi:hypothetical protein
VGGQFFKDSLLKRLKLENVGFQKMVRAPITKIGRASPKYFFIGPWYQLDVLMPWQVGEKERTGDFSF